MFICDIDMVYGKLINKLLSVLIFYYKKNFIFGVIGWLCDFMIYCFNRVGVIVIYFWFYYLSRIYICLLFLCLRCINLKKN